MADWKSSISRFAQNAAAKSKEMAETTRVNMEISNIEQKVKASTLELGAYVAEHPELIGTPDETVTALFEAISAGKAQMEKLQQTLLDLRNINICSVCGTEVSRDSKFCGKCGAPMDRSVMETPAATRTCPGCGQPVEDGMAFCANCGTKLN